MEENSSHPKSQEQTHISPEDGHLLVIECLLKTFGWSDDMSIRLEVLERDLRAALESDEGDVANEIS